MVLNWGIKQQRLFLRGHLQDNTAGLFHFFAGLLTRSRAGCAALLLPGVLEGGGQQPAWGHWGGQESSSPWSGGGTAFPRARGRLRAGAQPGSMGLGSACHQQGLPEDVPTGTRVGSACAIEKPLITAKHAPRLEGRLQM